MHNDKTKLTKINFFESIFFADEETTENTERHKPSTANSIDSTKGSL